MAKWKIEANEYGKSLIFVMPYDEDPGGFMRLLRQYHVPQEAYNGERYDLTFEVSVIPDESETIDFDDLEELALEDVEMEDE